MGFDGKTLMHPTQVEVGQPRVGADARTRSTTRSRVIAAFEEAEREGKGVVTVDGRMIENLHVDNARRMLAHRRGHRARWLTSAARRAVRDAEP